MQCCQPKAKYVQCTPGRDFSESVENRLYTQEIIVYNDVTSQVKSHDETVGG